MRIGMIRPDLFLQSAESRRAETHISVNSQGRAIDMCEVWGQKVTRPNASWKVRIPKLSDVRRKKTDAIFLEETEKKER